MRLIRFGPSGSEKPGLITREGKRLDLSQHFSEWNHEFFRHGGLAKLASFMSRIPRESLLEIPQGVRWASPVARPGKMICIGLNYSDHAKESGQPIPKEPIVFLKAPNTMVGPYDSVQIPRNSKKTDWEVELAVVIGEDARYLSSPQNVKPYIAGYCICHDVSEREFQLERGGQWTKGKSCDTFSPLGPWLATPDEIADVASLNMVLRVNGAVRQNGSTSRMIFDVDFLIYYLSQFMTLEAGDVISTGTPPGVGLGMNPPEYLKVGDIVELEIDELGMQRQLLVQA